MGEVKDSRQAVSRIDAAIREVAQIRKAGDPPVTTLRRAWSAVRDGYGRREERQRAMFIGWWNRFSKGEFFDTLEQMLSFPVAGSSAQRTNGRARPAPASRGFDARRTCRPAERPVERRTRLTESKSAAASKPRRIAAIDVGTNSIRLIIAET